MTEKERFDKWLPGNFINAWLIEDSWKAWQARAEIAKQDEKEMLEALIKEGRFIEKYTGKKYKDRNGMDKERLYFIPIIEKAAGKTWEELND